MTIISGKLVYLYQIESKSRQDVLFVQLPNLLSTCAGLTIEVITVHGQGLPCTVLLPSSVIVNLACDSSNGEGFASYRGPSHTSYLKIPLFRC